MHLSLTKALGSGEDRCSPGDFWWFSFDYFRSGSGHVSANTIDAGSFTFNAAASTEAGNAHNLGVVSASGTTTISLGSTTDLVSAIVASAGGTITKGTGSSDLTVNVGTSLVEDIR